MKRNYWILTPVFCLLSLTGCANVTTTKITRTATGLAIDSGKDVTIGALAWHGTNGESLIVSNYSSSANVEAIKAQGTREERALQQTRAMLKDAYEAGKAAAVMATMPPLAPLVATPSSP